MATFDGITSREQALHLAAQVMTLWPHRDSEQDGITVLADRGDIAKQPGLAGFGNTALDLHTETATIAEPPQLMMLICTSRAHTGGACRLADAQEIFRHLRAALPDLLEQLCQPRSVLFGGPAGYLGSVFELSGDRRVRMRLRTDKLAKFSPQLAPRISQLRQEINKCAISVPLQPGQGYLLSNTRWLHGRDAFDGQRMMYRLLGHPLPNLDIPTGFPAASTVTLR
jgi:alpha-ketoglutarate-dependent taurine dioxygenase